MILLDFHIYSGHFFFNVMIEAYETLKFWRYFFPFLSFGIAVLQGSTEDVYTFVACLLIFLD